MGIGCSFHVLLEVPACVPGRGRPLDQDDSAASTCKAAEVCTLGTPARGMRLDLPHSGQPSLLGNYIPPAPMPGPLFAWVPLSTSASCQPASLLLH